MARLGSMTLAFAGISAMRSVSSGSGRVQPTGWIRVNATTW